jgi:hypothetical protein
VAEPARGWTSSRSPSWWVASTSKPALEDEKLARLLGMAGFRDGRKVVLTVENGARTVVVFPVWRAPVRTLMGQRSRRARRRGRKPRRCSAMKAFCSERRKNARQYCRALPKRPHNAVSWVRGHPVPRVGSEPRAREGEAVRDGGA